MLIIKRKYNHDIFDCISFENWSKQSRLPKPLSMRKRRFLTFSPRKRRTHLLALLPALTFLFMKIADNAIPSAEVTGFARMRQGRDSITQRSGEVNGKTCINENRIRSRTGYQCLGVFTKGISNDKSFVK